jgi:hypothetical protein
VKKEAIKIPERYKILTVGLQVAGTNAGMTLFLRKSKVVTMTGKCE